MVTRVVAVTIDDLVLINLYTSLLRLEREAFFASLSSWNLPSDGSILTGDFNCVQSPLLDRLGRHRSCRAESPALTAFLDRYGWEDARLLRTHADEDDVNKCVDHFTYWEDEKEADWTVSMFLQR